jgi:hypothetical protein
MAIREPPPSTSEIPDLDLAVSSKGRAAPTTTSNRPVADPASAYGMAGILDDDLLGANLDSAALDIELSAPVRASGPAAASDRPWPNGVTPELGSVDIPMSQIEPLCTWGPKPSNWLQAVLYAYLVFQCRRQLDGPLRTSSAELAQAESRRDETLAALATSLKDTAAKEGTLSAAVHAVDAIATEHGQLAQQRQSVEASIESETQALDDALAKEQSKLLEFEAKHQHRQRDEEQAQLNLKREQARLQRLGIEQRNIEQSGAQDAAAQAKLDAICRQTEALSPQVESARSAVLASRSALDQVSAQIDGVKLHQRELERRRDRLIHSLSSQMRQASKAADSAVARKNQALTDLGRTILAANGRIAVQESVLKELTKHDETVAALWLRQQVYLQALENYDHAAVRRGTTIFVAILATFLLAFVWRLVT